MMRNRQTEFFESQWRTRYCSGGALRKTRAGRRARPLSTKDSLHLIFKANESGFRRPRSFTIVNDTLKKWAAYFHLKIESFSIQNDHIHLSIRAPKRELYLNFFRVVAGQIAQKLMIYKKTELPFWQARPYSRVIRGQKAWAIVRDYIQLNEKEITGEIPYRESRLQGLSSAEWDLLWA